MSRWWAFSRLKLAAPGVEREISLANCNSINHNYCQNLAAMEFYYTAIGKPEGFMHYVRALVEEGKRKMRPALRKVVDPEFGKFSYLKSKPAGVGGGLFCDDVNPAGDQPAPF